MGDRAEEKATKTVDVCTHVLADPYYEPGACSQCIVQALRAYAEEARREEREACALESLEHGYPDQHPEAEWDMRQCQDSFIGLYCCGPCIAAAIRARREK